MSLTITPTPLFSTGTPSVMNSNNVVSFSLPVFNTGTAPASNLWITGIVLGSAVRTGPVLPLSYHDMAVNSVKMVNAGFAAAGFIVDGVIRMHGDAVVHDRNDGVR